MTWRRNENEVREVTIRHDLHALSGLFQYPATHGWAFKNPVLEKTVKVLSDQDAIRFHRIMPGRKKLLTSPFAGNWDKTSTTLRG